LLIFVTRIKNSKFLLPISFQSAGINIWYFKIRSFYPTKFIAWNIWGFRDFDIGLHWYRKLENQSLCQRLIFLYFIIIVKFFHYFTNNFNALLIYQYLPFDILIFLCIAMFSLTLTFPRLFNFLVSFINFFSLGIL